MQLGLFVALVGLDEHAPRDTVGDCPLESGF
jgi:hypothetical protein